VELEVDRGSESSGNVKELLDIANNTIEKLYVKHHGIIDEGFEPRKRA